MAFITPDNTCGCCADCPVIFFFSGCRLYWFLSPIPAEPYTVTITTPSGTEVYDSIPSGMFETPATGTYTGKTTKDSVDSAICTIEIVACTPVNPCCVRTSGINTRLTGGGSFGQWKGGKVQFSTFLGAYAETTLPIWDYESLRVGSMSAGVKTDSNCYDLWGVADFPDFEDVIVGTGTIDFYSGMPGYANAAAVPCSVPATDYYLQTLSVTWYIRYTNTDVIFRATITAESISTVGGPGGTSPTSHALPFNSTLGSMGWGLCAADVTIITPDIFLLQTGGNTYSPCNGVDETVVGEWWPSVIPL